MICQHGASIHQEVSEIRTTALADEAKYLHDDLPVAIYYY